MKVYENINHADSMVSSEMTPLIESNLFDLMKYYGTSSFCQIYDHRDLLWISSDISSEGYNIISRGNIVDNVDLKIIETLQVFKKQKTPVLWTIPPSTEPTNLGTYLIKYGFNFVGNFSGMYISLPCKVETKLDSLETYLVDDEKTLLQWVELMENIFFYPKSLIKNQLELSLGVGKRKAYRRYIGVYKNKVIGTYSLFLNSDVVGIYHVGTCDKFRNKGLGTALIQNALENAYILGYKIAVLIATPKAKNMYQRIGFDESCEIDCFIWKKR